MCVKCYLPHYSVGWDTGLHSRERIKPPPLRKPTHMHLHTHRHTYTPTSESVFYLGTWVELPRQDSSQNPAHTHIHTSEKRGTSLLTAPVSTTPKSTNLSLSLSPPPHVCLSLQCLERGWNYCPAHTHRCKQTDTKQCLYWGISTVHSTKTEFTIVDLIAGNNDFAGTGGRYMI